MPDDPAAPPPIPPPTAGPPSASAPLPPPTPGNGDNGGNGGGNGANGGGGHNGDRRSYLQCREGQQDPDYGKQIDFLIAAADNYLVFLDVDDFLWWSAEYADEDYPEYYPRVINRVAILESAPVDHLTDVQRRSYRRLIGEAVARMLANEGEEYSAIALDAAAEFYKARGTERARLWYSATAVVAAALAGFVLLALWTYSDRAKLWLSAGGFAVALGACTGAIGALASILLRVGKLDLDPTAGLWLHAWASVCRSIVGVIAAAVLGLGLQAGLLGAPSSLSSTPGLLFLCMLAGASERLLPELVTRVDGTFTQPPGTPFGRQQGNPAEPAA